MDDAVTTLLKVGSLIKVIKGPCLGPKGPQDGPDIRIRLKQVYLLDLLAYSISRKQTLRITKIEGIAYMLTLQTLKYQSVRFSQIE